VLKKIILISLVSLWLLSDPLMGNAWAADAAPVKIPIDTGDTAFMLVSAALVLFMTPGLAFFYGGLVKARNILNTMMMSFVLMGVVGVTWVLFGYSLAFYNPIDDVATKATDVLKFDPKLISPYIGGIKWFGLDGVSGTQAVEYASTIPHQVFMVYQMMFAIITPALISGAIVERMSFKAYFWFVALWSTLIYAPLAHWVWGKGWLGAMGALDFAGGNVVHISSGVSAVVAAWVIGPRRTYKTQPAAPHNVPFVMLGIGMLWFGWFGFNGGSGLSAKGAVIPFVTTMIATAAAGLAWMILEWVLRQKPTAVGIASGFLAGLVGITPCAGYVNPLSAILVGAITATACFFAVSLRAKLQFDDSLDTFPIHGVGGTIGAILTGVFASKQFYEIPGADGKPIALGLVDGNGGQIVTQLISIVATYAFAAVGTFVILKGLALVMPLRAKEEAEYQGLDINEHGEEGYGEEFASGLSFAENE
jgi:ammonium transporter, Amt family